MRFSHFNIPDYYEFDPNFLHTLIKIIQNFSQKHGHPRPAIPKSIIHRPLSPVKAVVFDVYGTLLHSSAGEIHTEATHNYAIFEVPELDIKLEYNQVRALIKKYVNRQHSHMKKYQHIEYPEIDSIDMWLEIGNTTPFNSPIKDRQDAAICAVYHELYNNPSSPMPAALSVLKALHSKHIILGIVSNAQFYTPLFLETNFGDSDIWHTLRFPIQIWSYIHKLAKPSHELFVYMIEECKKYHIQPAEILYVGNDKRNDIAPPHSLGVQTLLFAGDHISFRPREKDEGLNTIQANAEIRSLQEIIELLDSIL